MIETNEYLRPLPLIPSPQIDLHNHKGEFDIQHVVLRDGTEMPYDKYTQLIQLLNSYESMKRVGAKEYQKDLIKLAKDPKNIHTISQDVLDSLRSLNYISDFNNLDSDLKNLIKLTYVDKKRKLSKDSKILGIKFKYNKIVKASPVDYFIIRGICKEMEDMEAISACTGSLARNKHGKRRRHNSDHPMLYSNIKHRDELQLSDREEGVELEVSPSFVELNSNTAIEVVGEFNPEVVANEDIMENAEVLYFRATLAELDNYNQELARAEARENMLYTIG